MVVRDQEIDHGPEWRNLNEGDSNSRVGPPVTNLRHDKGISSVIDFRDQDAYGRTLSKDQKHRANRLRKRDHDSQCKETRNGGLGLALGEMKRISSALAIPDHVTEDAADLYRQLVDEDALRGWAIDCLAAATLYVSCRRNDIPRTLDEFKELARTGNKGVGRSYYHVMDVLDLEIRPQDPAIYVPRIASEVGNDRYITSHAKTLLDAAKQELVHSGKNPVALAAGAVYAAYYDLNKSNNITQEDISEAANVCIPTIRTHYQDILDAAHSD